VTTLKKLVRSFICPTTNYILLLPLVKGVVLAGIPSYYSNVSSRWWTLPPGGVLIVQVGSHHSAPVSASLAEISGWIQFKLTVLAYRCIHGTALTYLADELLQPADLGIRTRLRSALTTSLPVRRTRPSIVGYRAFPVAAARTWNDLPRHVTSASPLPVFRSRLKTHLFQRSLP